MSVAMLFTTVLSGPRSQYPSPAVPGRIHGGISALSLPFSVPVYAKAREDIPLTVYDFNDGSCPNNTEVTGMVERQSNKNRFTIRRFRCFQ